MVRKRLNAANFVQMPRSEVFGGVDESCLVETLHEENSGRQKIRWEPDIRQTETPPPHFPKK